MPAFMEDLGLRSIVQRYIFSDRPYIRMLVSAFLFQSIHFTTRASDAAVYFLSGLAYAYLYKKTGRLEIPMFAHAMNNIIALAIFFFKSGAF